MKLEQQIWTAEQGWQGDSFGGLADSAQLLLIFGSTDALARSAWIEQLKGAYPSAQLLGCSTAGEICGARVLDDTVVATAIQFEHTPFAIKRLDVNSVEGSEAAGSQLARSLDSEGLSHVLVLSDGQQVNGSELVRGLLAQLPSGVQVTGGLAGDGARFERTMVLADEAPREGLVAALGLYGDRLRVGYGSLGGWDPFGPERLITKSDGNVLFELDGKPALELYKTYLGEHAAGLPATGLFFPLSIRRSGSAESLVRTILGVSEEQQSLTFAGDVPEGSQARLMKSNTERIIDGATNAARSSYEAIGNQSPDLAILISCVGRKLVLKQRTEEEVEGVRDILGESTVLTGFYSYGEICPFARNAGCELHNQTMTITTFSE